MKITHVTTRVLRTPADNPLVVGLPEPTDTRDVGRLRATLLGQADRVAAELRASGLRGRTVTLKLRPGLPSPTRGRASNRRPSISTAATRIPGSTTTAGSRRTASGSAPTARSCGLGTRA